MVVFPCPQVVWQFQTPIHFLSGVFVPRIFRPLGFFVPNVKMAVMRTFRPLGLFVPLVSNLIRVQADFLALAFQTCLVLWPAHRHGHTDCVYIYFFSFKFGGLFLLALALPFILKFTKLTKFEQLINSSSTSSHHPLVEFDPHMFILHPLRCMFLWGANSGSTHSKFSLLPVDVEAIDAKRPTQYRLSFQDLSPQESCFNMNQTKVCIFTKKT